MGIPCDGEHILNIGGKTIRFNNSTEFKAWLAEGGLKELVEAGLIKLPGAEEIKEAIQDVEKEKPEVVGISKKVIDPEMLEKGLNDSDRLFISTSDKKAFENAKQIMRDNPSYAQNLVDEVINGDKKSFSDSDPLVLLLEKSRLQNEYNAAKKEYDAAVESGNGLLVINAELKKDNIFQQQKDLLKTIKLVGSTGGKLLRHMSFLTDAEFTFAGLTEYFEDELGRKSTKAELTMYENIAKEHQDLVKKYNELLDKQKEEGKKTREQIEKEILDKYKTEIENARKKKVFTQKAKKVAEIVRGFKGKPFELKDENGNPIKIETMGFTWNDLMEGIAKGIEKAGELTDKILEKYLKKTDWYKNLTDEGKTAVKNQITEKFFPKEEGKGAIELDRDFKSLIVDLIDESEGVWHDGLSGVLQKILKNRVEKNLDTTIEEVVDDIHKAIGKSIPDLEKEEIRDLLAGYGEYKKQTEDKVKLAMAEIRLQGRLDAKLEATERGELPLRNGFERKEKTEDTLTKEALIAKNIKEKNLVPPPTEEEMAAVYKSKEQTMERALQREIDKLTDEIDSGIERQKTKPSDVTNEDIERLKKIKAGLQDVKDAKFKKAKPTELENLVNKAKDLTEKIGEARKNKDKKTESELQKERELTENAISDLVSAADPTAKRRNQRAEALQKAIDDIRLQIAEIRAKGMPDKDVVFKKKDGIRTFKFAKKPVEKIEDARLEYLENIKAGLEADLSDLMPESIKNKAIIEKEIKSRELRKKNLEKLLEKGKTDKSVFAKKEKEAKPYSKDLEKLNFQIRQLEDDVWQARERVRDEKRTTTTKAIEALTELQRFMIFLNPWGIGRLAYAAMFRPLITEVPSEIAKYVLSKPFVAKKIMEKSPTMYRPTIESTGRAIKNYYAELVSGKTFNDALSEFNSRSNFSLLFEPRERGRGTSLRQRILAKPEQTHGFLKSFAKKARLKSSYEAALENMSNMRDPNTGEFYDITDPMVQQAAMSMAVVDAYTEVFMQNSDMSKLVNNFLAGKANSQNALINGVAVFLKQQMPVLKVPQNFYHEIMQMLPGVGLLEAGFIVARSGKKGEGYRGVSNLTPEQASLAAKAMVNQAIGLSILGVGMVLYNKYGDDAIDFIEKHEYWFHNTAHPIIVMGMEMAKDMEKHPDKKTAGFFKEVGKVFAKETVKLPQVQAAEEVSSLAYSAGQASTEKLFRDKVGKDVYDKMSLKAKKMLATLLIPSGLNEFAKRLDKERKRDPETFAEILKMRIPGLRETVKLAGQKQTERGTSEFGSEFSSEFKKGF